MRNQHCILEQLVAKSEIVTFTTARYVGCTKVSNECVFSSSAVDGSRFTSSYTESKCSTNTPTLHAARRFVKGTTRMEHRVPTYVHI